MVLSDILVETDLTTDDSVLGGYFILIWYLFSSSYWCNNENNKKFHLQTLRQTWYYKVLSEERAVLRYRANLIDKV